MRTRTIQTLVGLAAPIALTGCPPSSAPARVSGLELAQSIAVVTSVDDVQTISSQ